MSIPRKAARRQWQTSCATGLGGLAFACLCRRLLFESLCKMPGSLEVHVTLLEASVCHHTIVETMSL